VGALLVAEPFSNRRFAGFDAVHALDVTGYSDFAPCPSASTGSSTAGSASRSTTATPTPRTTSPVRDWRDLALRAGFRRERLESDGTSDRSAPHRGLVALEWAPSASGAFRIGAVYRVRSGTPFTPRFRAGVDANGDGDPHNDPAFIDAHSPG
jgi:hypothetical protein